MVADIGSIELDSRAAVGPQLVRILRELIIANEIRAGDRISEAEFSERFGVSRQPVREAFIKLSDEGLLEIRPQRGTFVRKISMRSVEDARFIREAIESDFVRILAADPDRAMLGELHRQIEAQARLSEGPAGQAERSEFRRLDDLFHKTLAEAAGRQNLWTILDGVKSQMDRVRHLTTQTFDVVRLVGQHRAVVDAIAAGDAARAEAAMRHHLRIILYDLEMHLIRSPELFEGFESGWRGMHRLVPGDSM